MASPVCLPVHATSLLYEYVNFGLGESPCLASNAGRAA